MVKKKRKMKNRLKRILITVIIILIAFFFHTYNNYEEELNEAKEIIKNELNKKEAEQIKKTAYESCLNEKYNDLDDTDTINDVKDDLKKILNKYQLSIYYLDPNLNFEYQYNSEKLYYAASTIKMLDALYIYNGAKEGKIDLDEKIKYKKSNYMGESKAMKKHKVGDKIKIRDLVKYAIEVSDNTAHNILVEYIGFKNLKEYGKSLGATKTLIGGDIFGEIDIYDSIIYLTNVYNFINENNEYSSEFKDYFLNSEQNYLNINDDIKAGIKYGEYDYYYHENGIVFADNPYLISILTTIGNNKEAFEEINNKVYELHTSYYKERQNTCYNKIYNEKEDN